MKTEVKTQDLLNYIQAIWDMYNSDREKFGDDDRVVNRLFHQCIGMKTMVENLIGTPVNLQLDGKVTTGY